MSPGRSPPYRGAPPPSSGEINADSTPKVHSCKVCSLPAAGGGSSGTPPALGLLLPAFQSPLSRSARRGPVAAGAVNSSPAQKLAARPRESEPTERMWKVRVLLLVLARASFWVPAEGGKSQGERLPAAARGHRGRDLLECLGLAFEVAQQSRGEPAVCVHARLEDPGEGEAALSWCHVPKKELNGAGGGAPESTGSKSKGKRGSP